MYLEPLPTLTNNPIDAFSEMDLIHILGCSRSLAYKYTAGTAIPRRAELKLLTLLRDRRVMPEQWPLSMYFLKDTLVTPINKQPLTWAQVQQSQWVYSQWHQTMDLLQKVERGLKSVSADLSVGDLARVKPLQAELNEHINTESPLSHRQRQQQWFRRDGC